MQPTPRGLISTAVNTAWVYAPIDKKKEIIWIMDFTNPLQGKKWGHPKQATAPLTPRVTILLLG
jgi:hypothetical protein